MFGRQLLVTSGQMINSYMYELARQRKYFMKMELVDEATHSIGISTRYAPFLFILLNFDKT
jgi:hypothetical protein